MKIKEIFFSFLACISLVIFILFSFLYITLLNPKYIIHILEKNHIYEEISNTISGEMQNYIYQAGFNEDIKNEIFNQDMVNQDINNLVISIYKNQPFVLDTSRLEENLNNSINKHINEEDITNINEEALNNFKKEIINAYKGSIDLKKYVNDTTFMIVIKNIVITVFGVALIFTFVFLKLLKNKSLMGLSISLMFSGLVFFGLEIFLKTNLSIANITFFSPFISSLITCLINNLLHQFMLMGVIFLFLGVFVNLMKGKSINEKESN